VFLIFFFFFFFFLVSRNKIKVSCVLNTSHLDDHAGGNLALRKAFPSLRVFGFDKRIPGLTHLLRPNELVNVGQQRFRALFAPGITAGSGVFHVLSARRLGFSNSPNRNPHSLLFSGDTLTVGGCGRFGGDEMLTENAVLSMYKNLVLQIGSLPGDTEVYCSHE
jgi:glyoxylase-like metal-dependent hydrolase (beta-lactamase superfamily II)